MTVSRGTQRRFAALLWTLPGLGLAIAGSLWLFGTATGPARLGLLALAIALGVGKGLFLRRKPAGRVLARIEALGDGRRLGAFVGWQGILLVGLMMGAGRLLRMSPLPREILGALYLGIGAALLLASVRFWRAATAPAPEVP